MLLVSTEPASVTVQLADQYTDIWNTDKCRLKARRTFWNKTETKHIYVFMMWPDWSSCQFQQHQA